MSVSWTQAARAAMVMSMVAVAGTPAMAQSVLLSEDFENGNNSGWESTGGSQLLFSGGNPGAYLGVPYGDWYWITLGTDQLGNAATGDLTRHGGALEFAVDIRVFQLNNWFNEPMDPNNFPVVIQFIDGTGPNEVSVYFVGNGMPRVNQEWVRFTFQVPDPSGTQLPPGWGGTGDEDPVTYEPILPPGRTYRSVMQNVTEVRITTAVPGYFYIPSWWEVGFDNLRIQTAGGPVCYANCDGSTAAPILNVEDFTCFINEFASAQALPHEQQVIHYANCDGSTTAPVLNVDDFTCFINQFAAGCR
jgi:hypothetical protein